MRLRINQSLVHLHHLVLNFYWDFLDFFSFFSSLSLSHNSYLGLPIRLFLGHMHLSSPTKRFSEFFPNLQSITFYHAAKSCFFFFRFHIHNLANLSRTRSTGWELQFFPFVSHNQNLYNISGRNDQKEKNSRPQPLVESNTAYKLCTLAYLIRDIDFVHHF